MECFVSDDEGRNAPLSLKIKLVRTPIVLVIGYTVFLGQAAIGFIDVALSPRIRQLQVISEQDIV